MIEKIKIGLLGKKLSHSLSPLLHETILRQINLSADYNLYEVNEEEVQNFKMYMLENNIRGVNITIPYKKIFIDSLDYISEEAKEIGAINLMYIKDNKFYGENTDYYGFKYMLIKNNITVKDKKVAIVGKGGASAAVHKVLKDMGATDIKFYFRKDKESVIEFPTDIAGDIIINTTPVGMEPNINDNIIDEDIIKKFKVAIDLIYNPLETVFLKLAKKNGLIAINGMDMLVEQGIKTDEILFDVKIGLELREEIRYKFSVMKISKELLNKYSAVYKELA